MSDDISVPGLAPIASGGAPAPDGAAEATYAGIRETLESARLRTAAAVNTEMVLAYWEIGRRLVEAVGERAEYGKSLLRYLAQRLTAEFGSGFDESNLRNMRRFFGSFPIQETLSPELGWSHYNVLSRVADHRQRDFYAREAASSGWTVRQLRRQISTLYYERLLGTRDETRPSVSAEVAEH